MPVGWPLFAFAFGTYCVLLVIRGWWKGDFIWLDEGTGKVTDRETRAHTPGRYWATMVMYVVVAVALGWYSIPRLVEAVRSH